MNVVEHTTDSVFSIVEFKNSNLNCRMKHEGVVIAVMSAVYAVVKVNKWFCLIYILFVLHR